MILLIKGEPLGRKGLTVPICPQACREGGGGLQWVGGERIPEVRFFGGAAFKMHKMQSQIV